MNNNLKGLYIHIPFCQSKCDYCDFLSFANREGDWETYIDRVVNELEPYGSGFLFDTIYIGGGTPTVLPAFLLKRLLDSLPPALPHAEITCEANPGTLDSGKISVLAAFGVNRISLGLQAWQDSLLKNIGRQTTTASFLENYHALRNAGFNNINVDIMFALPGQSPAHWEETLLNVSALNPEHISAYALTLEENTPLWSKYGENICCEETDRKMYHYCKTFLQSRGYIQYEISNFCKPGFESRHNIRYWTRRPYFGIGHGAHSFDGSFRWCNDKKEPALITKADAMAEFMFLGLRMTKGVSEKDFSSCFGFCPSDVYGSWINKMIEEGLLRKNDGRIYLTGLGMDLANRVMAGFLE